MNRRAGIGAVIRRVTVFLLMILVMKKEVFAADFNAAVSSAEAAQGDTVTVTVSFSSGTNIGAYAMKLTYDANILEYSSGADGGGGGTLQFYNDYVNSTSKTYTISFQAKAAGTSALSLETISVPCDTEANDMTVKSSGGSVTVSSPASYSSNNNLAALNVALVYEDGSTKSVDLSPAFSAETTAYNLSIGENVARLSLDVSAEDGKAAVKVSGTRMDPGSNTTTITVTAENGDVKKYIIYTEKAVSREETTPEETTAPEETTVEETTAPEETTAEESTEGEETPKDPLEITLNGKKYAAANIPEGFELPEGYETAQMNYKGSELVGAKGLSTNLQLLYLIDQETQEGVLYIYDEEKEAFMPFISVAIRQHMYTILDIPEGIDLPFHGTLGKEYQKISIDIEGKSVQALKYDVEDFYLIYAMNWEGEYYLYFYDAKEGTMLRYQYSGLENSGNKSSSVSADASFPAQEKKNLQKGITVRNLIIIVLSVILAFLAGTIILVACVIRKQQKDDGYEMDADDAYEDMEDMEDMEDTEPMDEESLDKELDNILRRK